MTTDDTAQNKIGEIAAEMIFSKTDHVEIDAETIVLLNSLQGETFTIDDKTLRFISDEERHKHAAAHFSGQCYINDQCISEKWLEIASKLAPFKETLDLFLSYTVNNIDPFLAAAEAIVNGTEDLWRVLDVVRRSVSKIDVINTSSIIQLCDAQHEHTKHDLMRGRLFNEIGSRLETFPELCCEMLTALRPIFREDIASLYTTTIQSLAKSDADTAYSEATNDLTSENNLLHANALWSLGVLKARGYLSEPQSGTLLTHCTSNIEDQVDEVRNAALQSVVKGALVDDDFAAELSVQIDLRNVDAICFLASELFYADFAALKSNQNFNLWIASFEYIPFERESIVDTVVSILDKMYKKGDTEQVISVIENWLIQQGYNRNYPITKTLNSTTHEILQDQATLSRILTVWLVSDHQPLMLAADEIFSHYLTIDFHEPKFSMDVVNNYDREDIRLLLRRMLGFVDNETQLLSLTLSLLETTDAPKRTYPFVASVLTEEIGVDFPDDTVKKLEEVKSGTNQPELISLCDRVLKSINDYREALSNLPQIKELAPNPQHVERYYIERDKHMREVQKEAEKDSIIRQIATTIPLKAGTASFSFFQGEYREPSPLHPYEHYITLPRRFVFDSIGLELRKMSYRHSRKGEE
ncbi:hypothetical protein GCM10011332_31670 [Terasakiella brassicae]|uniref:Uncharacterized protein n=1 Tax=Terasakiella brassicae TaxID=1634917 RepID=A0A917C8U5_9PROT|nr:hypothetical protein [Terasakiella brassicae]GGF75353.1 hypothetical protein GCM10011332_31670 [Terasakiella brassicae]